MDDNNLATINEQAHGNARSAGSRELADDISITELWAVLTRRKAVFFLSVLTALMLAFAYIYFSRPVYEARTYLLPPSISDIQPLVIEDFPEELFTPESVYEKFLRNFRSEGLRREFFDSNKLSDEYLNGKSSDRNPEDIDRVFDELFSRNLRVQSAKQDESSNIATFEYFEPGKTSRWLNHFVGFVNEATVNQLYEELVSIIHTETSRLNDEVMRQMQVTFEERQDEITRLREAIVIARKLGIKDAALEQVASGKTGQKISVNVAEVPLYMRGESALQAQIDALESRKSDEPFIPEIRTLQWRLKFLENLKIDKEHLNSVTVDLPANVPDEPVRPRTVQTVAIAVTLGILIGIFAAFFMEFLAGNRKAKVA